MKITTTEWIFLFLAIGGLMLTWFMNVQFYLHAEEAGLSTFVSETVTNWPSKSIAVDISVAAFTFLIWMIIEGRRLHMPNLWVYFLMTFFLAFAVAFPLFLFYRERRLRRIKSVDS